MSARPACGQQALHPRSLALLAASVPPRNRQPLTAVRAACMAACRYALYIGGYYQGDVCYMAPLDTSVSEEAAAHPARFCSRPAQPAICVCG